MERHPVGGLVLAAGGSERLGRPKQLLAFEGQSFLRRICRHALRAGCRPVVAVLGARREEIEPEVEDLDVKIVFNERWREGMASSIGAGVRALENSDARAALIMTCDQPGVDSKLLRQIVQANRDRNASIVACRYDDTVGVPALFGREHFGDLKRLRGDRGAKRLLRDPTLVLDAPQACWDIDRESDYRSFVNRTAEGSGDEC